MARICLIFTCLLFCVYTTKADNNKEILLNKLDVSLTERAGYIIQKKQRIENITKELHLAEQAGQKEQIYTITEKLLKEYQSFNYDSSFKYVRKMNDVALALGDKQHINTSKIKMGFTLLSSGLFKESLDILLKVDVKQLSSNDKIEYFSTVARTYFDLADYDEDEYFSVEYRKISIQYLDSALLLCPKNTAQYYSILGLRFMKSADFENALKAFLSFLELHKEIDHDYAIATSSVAYLYSTKNQNDSAISYLVKAAISDIQSCTYETVALRNLANHLYTTGDQARAYQYIKIALEDATFYNARHRKLEIGAVLPIIEGERLKISEEQKTRFIRLSIILAISILFVIIFLFIIYHQLKEIKKVRTHLQETNNELQRINENLIDANTIKEKYIGSFFKINSMYISKIEEFQKIIHRKIVSRQYEDLNDILRNNFFTKERENLFLNFDQIFLKLFPNFIAEFNSLFKEEDRIILKDNELLNTDLRIFALIRLGITDSEQIAKFLDYSSNTIYTYKTKIKNKALVPRAEFEDRIMNIKAVK